MTRSGSAEGTVLRSAFVVLKLPVAIDLMVGPWCGKTSVSGHASPAGEANGDSVDGEHGEEEVMAGRNCVVPSPF